jgi:D-galacturonate reductase
MSGVNILMIGTGEYTTGFVDGKASNSDKGAGVVGITMFDLRSKGKVNRIGLCGVNGIKFPHIRYLSNYLTI